MLMQALIAVGILVTVSPQRVVHVQIRTPPEAQEVCVVLDHREIEYTRISCEGPQRLTISSWRYIGWPPEGVYFADLYIDGEWASRAIFMLPPLHNYGQGIY